ncbi:MAG TPA: Fe-S cluster assembly protein HesB [Streptosporangiaceae bacterium]|nr:Fe-S cluster assembly protein HesB [Streptosporangiaceae bacterium]
MLTLTDPAVEAIRILTTKPGLPASSGLRIVHGDTAGGLELSITSAPDSSDQVIETGGVRVFIQAEAAALLGGKALNAEIADDDDVVFRVDERSA